MRLITRKHRTLDNENKCLGFFVNHFLPLWIQMSQLSSNIRTNSHTNSHTLDKLSPLPTHYPHSLLLKKMINSGKELRKWIYKYGIREENFSSNNCFSTKTHIANHSHAAIKITWFMTAQEIMIRNSWFDFKLQSLW